MNGDAEESEENVDREADDATERERSRASRSGTGAGPVEIIVRDKEGGLSLARLLRKRHPRLPFSLLHQLLRKRRIVLNGQRADANARVSPGDRILVCADLSDFERPSDWAESRARRRRESPRFKRSFRVLHEDEALIALDKPSGLVVHPSRDHHSGDTLLDLLAAHLPRSFDPSSEFRPAFVHRLDRGTSGVIVAAKTRKSARALEQAFRTGRVRKTYIALVRGRTREDEGVIRSSIAKTSKPSGITRYRSITARKSRDAARREEDEEENARDAVTHWRVRERFARRTLLEVEPGTGRTHQIRVHLASADHPILGDGDYGNKEANRAFRERYGSPRLFLHAERLELPHPETSEPLILEAPLPRAFRDVLSRLRADEKNR
ncbi:MAG TPA: RluA family pseudouridine synthase [Planctomycetota bacterium]|nr:RluA family pseudouridine synthase [Planctomycetota bacterium]